MNVQIVRARWHLKENQKVERFPRFVRNAEESGNLLLNNELQSKPS